MSKMTIEERRKLIAKLRQSKLKETQKIEKKQQRDDERLRERSKYPPTIAVMQKRIKRIDPWNTVVRMDPLDASMIVFYKLKQKGLEDVRIVTSAKHSWVEFKFDEHWYIVDVIAVRNKEFGEAIKNKIDADNPIYKNLVRYFYNIDDFIESYDDDLSIDKDDAQIEAMKDEGLNTFLIIKYF